MRQLKSYLTVLLTLIFIITSFAQTKERKDIPQNYKWNLTDLYSSVGDWKTAKEDISTKIDKIESFKGKLDKDAGTLLDAMTTYFGALKEYFRFSTYSGLLADEDLSVSPNQELRQEACSTRNKILRSYILDKT